MTLSFATKKEAIEAGKQLKARHIKAYKNILVWIERESGKFIVYHNLTGSISNHMNKIQHIID